MSPEEGKYISLAEAASHSPYSQEYLSLLARSGKIDARKFGRNWYTTLAALSRYTAKHAEDVSRSEPIAPRRNVLRMFSLAAVVFFFAWSGLTLTHTINPNIGTSASIVDSFRNVFSDLVGNGQTPASTPIPTGSSPSPQASSPLPSVAGTSSRTTVISVSRNLSPTQSQLLAALRAILRTGLPSDLAAQLRGPKGEPGAPGQQIGFPNTGTSVVTSFSNTGFTIGAVTPTILNPNNVGTLGGVTFFGAREITTQTLTVPGLSKFADLTAGNVSGTGNGTFDGNLLVSGTASVSTLYVNGTLFTPPASVSSVATNSLDFGQFKDALTLDANTTVANNGFSLTFQNASVSANLEVFGNASASATFGSGLTPCTSVNQFIQYLGGQFSCGSITGTFFTGLAQHEGTATPVHITNLTYDAGMFNFSNVASSGTLKLDWVNGPASRSAPQTITGAWTFTNASNQFTNTLEVGTASISALNLNGALTSSFTGSNSFAGSLNTTLGIHATGNLTSAASLLVSGTGSSSNAGSMNITKSLTAGGTTVSRLTNTGTEITSGLATFNGGVSVSTNFEVTGNNRVGINAGGSTDTTLEVGGTASISGATTLGSTLSVVNAISQTGANASNSFAGSLNTTLGIHATGNLTSAASLLVSGTGSSSNAGSMNIGKSLTATNSVTAGSFVTNGALTVGGQTTLANASVSGNFELTSATATLGINAGGKTDTTLEVGGTASVSGTLFANGALTVLGQTTFVNASGSGSFELTSATSLLGINAGGKTDTTLEVGGTASISGKVSLANNASISQNLEVTGYASVSQLFGAGLKDCDNTNQKLFYTASGSSAGKFSCGFDNTVNNIQAFAAGAAQTWTRPASVSQVYVEVWGGGGSGKSGAGAAPGGGGGGGGYSAGLVTVTGNVTVNVGTTAGNSSFAGATTPTGNGGTTATTGAGAAGGTASGGTINITGGTGGSTTALAGEGGGSGGGSPMGGAGGSGGGGGNTANINDAGTAGTVPGGGGGGASAGAGAAAGGVGADGRVIVWAYTGTSRSDIAEWYETDGTVGPGDLVTMSSESLTYQADTGTHTIPILTRANIGDKIFGVVSTYPEIYMGKDLLAAAKHPQPIALAGRVPVRVSTENGSIKPGDLLAMSSVPGVAERSDKAGQIIGSALEDYNGAAGSIGSVLTLVQTGYSTGARLKTVMAQHGIDLDAIPENVDVSKAILAQMIQDKQSIQQSTTMSEVFSDRIVAGLEMITPRVVTDVLEANTIKLGGNDIMTQFDSAASESVGLQHLIIDTKAMLTDADVRLAQSVASVSGRLNILLLRMDALASASAAGMAFTGPVQIHGGLRLDTISSLTDAVNIMSDTFFFGHPYFTADTAGFAVFDPGSHRVRITYDHEYLQTPIVSLTMAEPASASGTANAVLNQNLHALVSQSDTTGFTIVLDHIASSSVQVNWTALAVHDARTVHATPEPTPTPTPSVTPTPTSSPTLTPTPSETPAASTEPTVSPTPELSPTASPSDTPTPEPSASPSDTPPVLTPTPEPSITP